MTESTNEEGLTPKFSPSAPPRRLLLELEVPIVPVSQEPFRAPNIHMKATTGPFNYTYPVQRVLRVVDGDTVDLNVSLFPPGADPMDLGFHVILPPPSYTGRFRLTIVDTPERGQIGYREATTFVQNWLLARLHTPPGLQISTYRDPDNFGRYLGDIFVPRSGDSLSSELLELGYATYKP